MNARPHTDNILKDSFLPPFVCPARLLPVDNMPVVLFGRPLTLPHVHSSAMHNIHVKSAPSHAEDSRSTSLYSVLLSPSPCCAS